ncbi:hypothetical protein PAPYR_8133 [Paratrimastix pyriformis]|uniref:EamA domain-containing protein n=1 Tax=Paratrimastix pyriformis TaxID=342808 RepID=A0ABQ8UB92_9EUKA|nr:hypothetical protein PAPYR_8133 [Paratrimastix pyriformis]
MIPAPAVALFHPEDGSPHRATVSQSGVVLGMALSRDFLHYLSGHAVLFLSQCIWSGYSVLARYATFTFDSVIFSFFRLLGATLILAVAAFFLYHFKRRPYMPGKDDWKAMALYAFTGGFFNQLSNQYALRFLSASEVSMFSPLGPVSAMVFGLLLHQERYSHIRLAAVALALLGAAVMLKVDQAILALFGGDDDTPLSWERALGYVFAISNALNKGLLRNAQKAVMDRLSMTTANVWMNFLGFCGMALLSPFFWSNFDPVVIAPGAWVALAYSIGLAGPVLAILAVLVVLAGCPWLPIPLQFWGSVIAFMAGQFLTLRTPPFAVLGSSARTISLTPPSLLLFAVLGSVIAFMLGSYSARILSPTVCSLYGALAPFLTTSLAVVFLDEVLTPRMWVGCFIVVGSLLLVILARYREKSKSRQAQTAASVAELPPPPVMSPCVPVSSPPPQNQPSGYITPGGVDLGAYVPISLQPPQHQPSVPAAASATTSGDFGTTTGPVSAPPLDSTPAARCAPPALPPDDQAAAADGYQSLGVGQARVEQTRGVEQTGGVEGTGGYQSLGVQARG